MDHLTISCPCGNTSCEDCWPDEYGPQHPESPERMTAAEWDQHRADFEAWLDSLEPCGLWFEEEVF